MYGINRKSYNIILIKYYSFYTIADLSSHSQSVSKRTTVSLEIQVYQRLRSRGQFGESFSELVKRVLDELDKVNGGIREK